MSERKVTVIEFSPKMRQPNFWIWNERCATAFVEYMILTPEEAQEHKRIGRVWQHMLREWHVNMKFIVVPNGLHLPVLSSHYA